MGRRKPRIKEEIDADFDKHPPTWNLETFEGCCEYLRFLRDESLDDIPEELFILIMTLIHRKARKGWWRGVISVFDGMEKKAILLYPFSEKFKI